MVKNSKSQVPVHSFGTVTRLCRCCVPNTVRNMCLSFHPGEVWYCKSETKVSGLLTGEKSAMLLSIQAAL